jgi:outer membrane lipoprotein carrier protein
MANLLRQPAHARLAETLAFRVLTLVAAFAFLSWLPAAAGGTSDAAKAVVQAVETRYHTAKTLKAIFLERYSEGRQQVRVESGTVYFSRPGRMRWEYEEPEKKLFLTDGKTAWFYVPSDHTVTRAPMKESTDWRTPLALLTGKADIGRLCSKVDLAKGENGANPGDVVLRCKPRGGGDTRGGVAETSSSPSASQQSSAPLTPGDAAQIREILMEVEPNTGWLSSVIIRQAGGVEIEFRFGRWEENIPIQEVMFHFSTPRGVAIVDGAADSNPRR